MVQGQNNGLPFALIQFRQSRIGIGARSHNRKPPRPARHELANWRRGVRAEQLVVHRGRDQYLGVELPQQVRLANQRQVIDG